MKIVADIDIDLKNREEILEHIDHIPASTISKGDLRKHNVGVYLQSTPVDPMTGLCSLEYEEAEERGYFKFDFLNVHLYEGVNSEAHLIELIETEPVWEMLLDEDISSRLFQLGRHANVLQAMKPISIDQLAMILAMIRPGKSHLVGRPWSVVESEVWDQTDDGYSFKKSHAISYAIAIVVQMNLMVEEAIRD